MSGLAEICLNLGYPVTGSDVAPSPITSRLSSLGMKFHEGHAAENLGDAGIVVVSAAIAENNVELEAARKRNIPVIHRSDLLADLIRLKPNAVVVGGSHGKTTVTSMISAVLEAAEIGATSIVGGILRRSGTNAHWGTGDYIVAEADEHDGSFLRLSPTISVVTNVDGEHLEYYGTVDAVKRAFVDFCNAVPFYGYAILCADDPVAASMAETIESVRLTYGLNEGASLRGENVRVYASDTNKPLIDQVDTLRTQVDVVNHEPRLGAVAPLGVLDVKAIGLHNARNALAACAVGLCLGMPFDRVAAGIASFEGVHRRMQVRGTANGAVVIEDYAHHPTEIAATLDAVRALKPERLICVFQPHLYSRTKFFFERFAEVLAQADRAIVTDIYPAREAPMPGVDSGLIVNHARRQGWNHVELVADREEVPGLLRPGLKPGDVVLVMGAGNVNQVANQLVEEAP